MHKWYAYKLKLGSLSSNKTSHWQTLFSIWGQTNNGILLQTNATTNKDVDSIRMTNRMKSKELRLNEIKKKNETETKI